MQRYQWNLLNKQQVGTYTEYFVKMEFTMFGLQVYSSEVDDRGIDFVVRLDNGPFFEIQVKSLRKPGYLFMQKSKFSPNAHLYLAFGLLLENQPPELYLIPSTRWLTPDSVFVEHNYEGLKSPPEWGLNISKKNMPALEPFRFDSTLRVIQNEGQRVEPE